MIAPDLHHGDSCIKGTRIPVAMIVGRLADGMTPEEIQEAYPQLTAEDIQAALAYAADVIHRVKHTSTSRDLRAVYPCPARAGFPHCLHGNDRPLAVGRRHPGPAGAIRAFKGREFHYPMLGGWLARYPEAAP
jgi:uncharacterized protein (DUF433 family)